VLQISLNVQIHQELHVRRKISSAVGPQQQMEVIPHDAVGENPHGNSGRGFGHKCKERREIGGLMEDRFAVIAAIDDVLNEAVW
jgi:hypothetical protein